jgi:hypothetical protein
MAEGAKPRCRNPVKAETATGHKSGRGNAQAGFVLGIIAVVASIINMIVTAVIIAS